MEINGGDICFGSTNFHLMILLKKKGKEKGDDYMCCHSVLVLLVLPCFLISYHHVIYTKPT